MKTHHHLLTASLLLTFTAATLPTRAEEKPAAASYLLAESTQPAPAGRKETSTLSMEMPDLKIVMKVGGNNISGKGTMVGETESDTNYETPDKFTLRTKMEKVQTVFDLGGQEQNETEEKPLHGTTVIGEKIEGKWKCRLAGGIEPDAKQAKELREMEEKLNKVGENKAFPKDKVAVGYEWDVEGEAVADFVGETGDDKPTGKLHCKFEKIEEIEGVDCAVIQFEGIIDGGFGGDEEEAGMAIISAELVIKGTLHRALDREPYDVKTFVEGTMAMKMGGEPAPGQKLEMEMSGPIVIEEVLKRVDPD